MMHDGYRVSITNENNQTESFYPSIEEDEKIREPIPDFIDQLIPSLHSLDFLNLPDAPPAFPHPNETLPMTKITNDLLKEEGFVINLAWDISIQNHPESSRMKQAFIDAAQLLVNSICSKVQHHVICFHNDTFIAESSTSLFVVSYELLKEGYLSSCQSSKLRTEFAKHNFPQGFPNPLLDSDNNNNNDSENIEKFVISDTQRKLFNIQIGQEVTNSHLCFINLSESSYDLVGCCLHEITETMGRISPFEQQHQTEEKLSNYRSIMDLGNYTSENERNKIKFQHGAYFSTNNGKTKLAYLNQNINGDSMDWDSQIHTKDCFKAISKPNMKESLTFEDLVLLEILGFDLMPITYHFGQNITLPVDAIFQFPAPNNYCPQNTNNSPTIVFNSTRFLFASNLPIFSISPSLPNGLIFDSEKGTLAGQTNEPISQTLFTVKINLFESNVSGSFYLKIESSPNYEARKQRELLAKKLQQLKQIRKDVKPIADPHANEIESTTALSTTDIIIITLFSVVVLIALIGLGVFIAEHIKK